MYKFITAIAAGFFLFILWIIYLANTGGSNVFFDIIKHIPYGDKLGHFVLFGFLTLVTIAGSKFRSFSYSRHSPPTLIFPLPLQRKGFEI